MLSEATLDALGTFLGEAIRVLILFVAHLAEAVPLIGSEGLASLRWTAPKQTSCVLVGDETSLVEIDRASCSTMGGALSPVRLEVLLTFRADDQRWAWHIPR